MSCYSCLMKFSFFTKEHSCPNCNYSFCSKCLKQKAILGGKEKNVCKNCFKKLGPDSNIMSSPEMDTPDLLKRLETLENPAKPPITIFRHNNRLTNLKYGLSSEDKKILERLEKLKADYKVSNLPDESEIKRRLALLRNQSEESVADKPNNSQTPQISHQDEVEDLLNQYMEEVGIQSNLKMEDNTKLKDIEGRLKKLQVSGSTATSLESGNQIDEDEDEDSVTAKIIKKAIAEGQLEKKLEDESVEKDDDSIISDVDQNEPEVDEFPWCIICNEDAVLRCFGCDGSLYCNNCFKQGHEFFNMEDHKFIPFEKKDPFSED